MNPFSGVLPAITTPFDENGNIDHTFLAHHVTQMLDAGCKGIVPLGSLGETATLTFDEKCAVMKTVVGAAGPRGVVTPGIAGLSTAEAVRLAQAAHHAGCHGLMVLPPYAYSTDWREMKAHVAAIIRATPLPCMIYNNPIAYKTDFLPAHIAELAREYPSVAAVKESSADIRRIAAIKALIGERLNILVGVDDLIVEGIAAGAVGWVAGLVAAFPKESVVLFDLARAEKHKEVEPLYHWFLPLLRLDVVPKFVQLIKLTQARVGMGNERVRAPRLELVGEERAAALEIIDHAIATRPRV